SFFLFLLSSFLLSIKTAGSCKVRPRKAAERQRLPFLKMGLLDCFITRSCPAVPSRKGAAHRLWGHPTNVRQSYWLQGHRRSTPHSRPCSKKKENRNRR